MRRIIQSVSLVVCLTVIAEAPRGLALAAIVAGLGIARTLYVGTPAAPAFDIEAAERSEDVSRVS